MTPRARWVAAAAIAVLTACTGSAGPSGPAGPTGPSGPSGASTGTITGVVTDQNDVPLSGALVQIDPGEHSATASATGAFSVVVPIGTYTVSVAQPGFQTPPGEVVSVVAGAVANLTFALLPESGAAVVAAAGPDRFQVGFGAAVQLDGSGSTGAAGATLTYRWEQISGPSVALTGGESATPTFTTWTLDQLEQNGLYTIRRSLGTLGFSEADVARASYVFDLVVDDGATSAVDRVVIRPAVAQAGLPVVAVDTVTALSAGDQPTYAWTCLKDGAACAAGVLGQADTRTPSFRADGPGLYVLQTTGEAPLEVRAATYLGARPVVGQTTCSTCHTDRYSAWSATGHATYLQRALDGELRTPEGGPVDYQAECIRCHTTGYNPDAANGGFAQVAAAAGWTFPTAPTVNTYQAMPDAVKSLASVGCENCHGPGSLHASGPSLVTIGKSFSAIDCAQCHATEPYENQGLQWVNSRHSKFISGFRPAASDPALQGTCSSCHSSQGFVAWAKSGTTTNPPVAADVTEPQTCSACHDPHGEATTPDGQPTPRQLRVYGDVTTLVPGLGARSVGPAALCMTCHNSRRAFDAVGQAAPHAPSQTNVLLAKTANLLGGGAYPSSVHAGVPKLCVGCHMAPTPALGTDGHNLVGGHSFAMRNGSITNTGACTTCHGGLETFDRTAYGDYDGDGFLEGVQTEVTGLAGLVQEQLTAQAASLWPVETEGPSPAVVSFHGRIRILKHYVDGVSSPACNPGVAQEWPETCFAFAAGAIPQATGAQSAFLETAWNYFLIEGDRSRGVHNVAFTVSVLQRSYQALAGVPVPNATPR